MSRSTSALGSVEPLVDGDGQPRAESLQQREWVGLHDHDVSMLGVKETFLGGRFEQSEHPTGPSMLRVPELGRPIPPSPLPGDSYVAPRELEMNMGGPTLGRPPIPGRQETRPDEDAADERAETAGRRDNRQSRYR